MFVVGEVLVDLIPAPAGGFGERAGAAPGIPVAGSGAMAIEARFGGSPANVAVGLARLEVPVRFAGRLSGSGYGPWLRSHLEAEKVDLSASVSASEASTLAVVTLDERGVATYEFYGPETADWAWKPGELPEPSSLAGDAVHTGSLATAFEPGAGLITAWLRDLRSRGDVLVSYDPNIRSNLLPGRDLVAEVLEPALRSAHLVKVSDEDLSTLYPGEAPAVVAERWLAAGDDGSGPELVVVTAGPDGGRLWHRDGRTLHVPAVPVAVVDTVGAGDSFTSGLLSALHDAGGLSPGGLRTISDGALGSALRRGVRTSGLTCGRAGSDPPRRAELDP